MTTIPSQIGPYTIASEIGRGGMGVVYLATDSRLDRKVAIKALPEFFRDDAMRMERFEREAKTLASLNHPNVAAIYGVEDVDGARYLVMEYVDGETLAERLDSGPLPVDEALDVCAQVAAGLEAAHDAGVIHRDLKPANIKITTDGQAKVLDFGLARIEETSSSGSSVSQMPTLTTPHSPHSPTTPGQVLGTAPYMSPEQARGRKVDKRSDIWSFGVVLYECLTGMSPFVGETATDSIGAILHKDVDFDRLPPNAPRHLNRVLQRCLRRDRKERWRDIGDVRLELSGASDDGPEEAQSPAVNARLWAPLQLLVVAALAVAVGAVGSWSLLPAATVEHSARGRAQLDLVAPDSTTFATFNGPMALSPDGDQLAFVATSAQGATRLHVRDLATGSVQELPGTEGAVAPFWSPDGESLGFVSGSNLYTIFVDGGRPVLLAEGGADETGGAWSSDGTIVFGADEGLPLSRVRSTGGEVSIAFDLDPDRVGDWVMWPRFLPDGRHLLFAIQDIAGGFSGVFVADLDTGESQRILEHASNAFYVESGHIVYWRDQSLFAREFDLETFETGSTETRIAQNVLARDWPAHGLFTVSPGGRIVYYERGADEAEAEFVWYDRDTGETESIGIEGILWNPRLSHDGARLAYDRTTIRTSGDVWVRDLARGTDVRLTRAPSDDSWPVWSLDDSELYFYMTPNLMRAASNGAGQVATIHENPNPKTPNDLTPDGRRLVFHERAPGSSELRMVDLDSGEVTACLGSPPDSWGTRISPNGRWAIYSSESQGIDNTYLASFPDGEHRLAVSSAGGGRSIWSPDGSEIIYENDQAIYSVSVEYQEDGPPIIGEPRVIVPFEERRKYVPSRGFDVSPDSDRLLLIRSRGGQDQQQLTVLENALPLHSADDS